MAGKDHKLKWSTTAASNTDIANIGIQGTNLPSNFDNALREYMKEEADAITRAVTKTVGTYTAALTDHNQFWRCTGAVEIDLTAAATLTTGWCLWIRANGGAVTIDPNGSETIDGSATSLVLADGQTALIICTGTEFFTVMQGSAGGSVPAGHLYGLVLTNDAGDATNDIGIAVGSAASADTDPIKLSLSTAIVKRLDAAWAVGTANGGLDTGAVGNSTYYVWLIRRADTGVVDALFSLSSTAPTMPTNYTQKALIGSFARTGAVNQAPRSYSEKEATAWVTYTPTFTGFGTAASISVWSRRIGDTLHIRGRFASGTSTAVEARMTLGFKGVNGVLVADTTKVPTTHLAGYGVRNQFAATLFSHSVLAQPTVGYVMFGVQNSASLSALSPANGSAFLQSGDLFSFTAEIPILGW